MSITHSFVSAKADDPDNTLIRPSNWNATHTIGANTIGDAEIAAHATTKITLPETLLSLADSTVNDVTTTKHGFVPKLPNDATKYLDGTGGFSVPAGSGSSTPGLDYQSIEGCLTTQPWEEIVQGGGIQITEVAGNNAIRIDAEFDMHFLLMGA